VTTRVEARPFLKWAGGKTFLLPELLKRAPKTFGAYFEPFLGGGALFFALKPTRAFLSDTNEDLICCYKGVRSHLKEVRKHLIDLAKGYAKRDARHYYEIRDSAIAQGLAARAARLIYLNKTCFNGLYRVNRAGKFNVPVGSYKNPTICDWETLDACSSVLRRPGVKLAAGSFEKIKPLVKPGDFVYFDPPYAPIDAGSFVSYAKAGFGIAEQERLMELAMAFKRRGAHVLLSNSDTPFVRQLYRGWRLEVVEVPRRINSKGAGRGNVNELIIS
jgi:DNA adenine methylase